MGLTAFSGRIHWARSDCLKCSQTTYLNRLGLESWKSQRLAYVYNQSEKYGCQLAVNVVTFKVAISDYRVKSSLSKSFLEYMHVAITIVVSNWCSWKCSSALQDVLLFPSLFSPLAKINAQRREQLYQTNFATLLQPHLVWYHIQSLMNEWICKYDVRVTSPIAINT